MLLYSSLWVNFQNSLGEKCLYVSAFRITENWNFNLILFFKKSLFGLPLTLTSRYMHLRAKLSPTLLFMTFLFTNMILGIFSTKYKIGISKKQFGLALNTKKKFVVTFLLWKSHKPHFTRKIVFNQFLVFLRLQEVQCWKYSNCCYHKTSTLMMS